MRHIIPIGTSEPQDFELRNDGQPFNGTGFSVELVIERKTGTTTEDVTTPPTVAWLDQAAGTVRVTGQESLEVGNYLVRYKLTDLSSNIGFFPNGEKADIWNVVRIDAR